MIVENLTNLAKIPSDLFELSAVPLAMTGPGRLPGPRLARPVSEEPV